MKTLLLIIGIMVAATIVVNAQTKTALTADDLPKTISDDLSNTHKDWNFVEAYKIDDKGTITYKVIVKKDMKEVKLLYDSNGKFLKQEPYDRTQSMKDKPSDQQSKSVEKRDKENEPHPMNAGGDSNTP
jgi:hypothetical protein